MGNGTTSVWIATSKDTHFESLNKDVKVDVAIVGGGIAGLTTALLLKNAGITVAVVEKSRIATGETGYTTAHITEVIDTGYTTLKSDFGLDGARLAAESSRASVEQIAAFVKQYNLSCGFSRLPAYVYTETDADVASLIDELLVMQKVGIDADWVDDAPLPYPTKGAIKVNNQAQFHPRDYLLPLANAIYGDGSYVFENTRATEIDDGEPCCVHTPDGMITAKNVVIATNSPVSNWLFLITKIPAYRTYAIGAVLKDERPIGGLFWDTADPYHYIRSQSVQPEDGNSAHEILIVGGEDHKTGTKEHTEECFERLESYTRARFDIADVLYRWSGQIMEPIDGLPYIGVNSFAKHQFVATGFTGNGMTFGTLSGMILSDLILGKKNRYAELYDATRIHALASASDFVSENKDFPTYFVGDRLAKADTDSLDQVGLNEGKIVKLNGEKAAVYRDEHGQLHACSPVCTHMACYVHWNNAEKSWDCPCHGSRFDPDGKVANGPAVKDLEPIKLPEAAPAGE